MTAEYKKVWTGSERLEVMITAECKIWQEPKLKRSACAKSDTHVHLLTNTGITGTKKLRTKTQKERLCKIVHPHPGTQYHLTQHGNHRNQQPKGTKTQNSKGVPVQNQTQARPMSCGMFKWWLWCHALKDWWMHIAQSTLYIQSCFRRWKLGNHSDKSI